MTYEINVKEIESNLNVIKGELYNFVEGRKKKAVATIRKSLLNLMKIAKNMRKLVQNDKKAMPIRKKRKAVVSETTVVIPKVSEASA